MKSSRNLMRVIFNTFGSLFCSTKHVNVLWRAKAILKPIKIGLTNLYVYWERMYRYNRQIWVGYQEDQVSQMARLRQYSHTVDKGLHNTNWQHYRGQSIYWKLRKLYERIIQKVKDDQESRANYCDELAWTSSIIEEYESRHENLKSQIEPLGRSPKPPCISQPLLNNFLTERTSSRVFIERPVDRKIIEEITYASLQAPSSCARQPIMVFASVNPSTVKRILTNFSGFTGFSDFVPACLVFAVDIRSYSMPSEVFAPTLDAGLGVSNGILSANAFGLSTVLLTWSSHTKKQDTDLRTILNIPKYLDIVVGCALGYPEVSAIKPVRKSVSASLVILE